MPTADPSLRHSKVTPIRPPAKPLRLPDWSLRAGVMVRSFALLLAVWWVIALIRNNPIQLPDPGAVWLALVELAIEGEVLEHASVSASRLVLSLLIACLLAIPLGFLMGLSTRAQHYLDPVVELLRPVSGIAWIPLALFIFGIGNVLPVFIMVYVAFFPLLLNTIAGVQGVDRKLLSAARTMGISRVATLRHVIAPAALPTIMVGLRLAFAGGWTAVVAAELIGAPSGLGFAVEWYRGLLMTPKVFAFIALIGVVGFFSDLALRALQRRITPWTEGTGL